MINETRCGVAISPDNKIAFVSVLIHLADNSELLADMGIAAKKMAKTKFDRNNLSSKFVQWLEKWS